MVTSTCNGDERTVASEAAHVRLAPAVPAGLAATDVKKDSATLQWSAVPGEGAAYRVAYRPADGGDDAWVEQNVDAGSGDIVTFQDPEIPGRVLIKRCIAVGGQTVDINDEDGLVYVDGVALSEPYTRGLPSYTLASDVSYPYTVPEGYLWMMGDNRTNSQDSRFFGAIPVSSVTGRGALVYWPLNDFSLLD